MAGEPITLTGLLKYAWGPILAILGFFVRKELESMEKRLEKLEEEQKSLLTEEKVRQTVIDLLAPIYVIDTDIKEDIKEIKDELKKKN